MSAVAGSGMSESIRAESRGIRFFALASLIVAVHLAGLAVLLTTEYGPFAITLSVLAWVFVNCFLLVVLQRPGICAALALVFIVILITLSHFKFGILQLTLTFLDFLIIDRDTFSFLLSVFPRLQMQLMVAGLVAVPDEGGKERKARWSLNKAIPKRGSPLLVGDLLYLAARVHTYTEDDFRKLEKGLRDVLPKYLKPDQLSPHDIWHVAIYNKLKDGSTPFQRALERYKQIVETARKAKVSR